MGPSPQDCLAMYRAMTRIRLFEERATELFRAGELPGFIHSSVGQEAVAVGMTYPLRTTDSITSTHRGHGHVIAKGAELGPMFAELYGRDDGFCRGRGGSMHIMDVTKGILGANGIVGAGIPIATGAGLAVRLDDGTDVVMSFFGDGAVNTGAFHEALNLAALWKVPVIFVCENNYYAESTPLASNLPIPDLTARGAAYDIPTAIVDGNDVRACVSVATEAIERARSRKGPTLIQANTYRWYGHHTGDTAPYRTADEVDEWRLKDPISLLGKQLVEDGIASLNELAEITKTAEREIEEAVEFGRASRAPDTKAVLTHVYPPRQRPIVPTRNETLETSMREALQLALRDTLEHEPNAFIMGEDIADPMGGSFKITLGLSELYGQERVRNTPISELGIVGAGVGAAIAGKRPIVEIMYSDFLTIAMDQIVNQAALIHYMSGGQVNVPLVIRCQGGGWRSSAAQHSKTLEAWFAHVPGLKLIVPSNPQDAYWLLREAIADNGPVIFYEPNLLYPIKGTLDLSVPPPNLSGAATLRAGDDLTLLTWGYTTQLALDTASALAERGISAEVIDLRWLAPLPIDDIIASVQRTGLCCIVHEAWETCGVGAEIAARCADEAFFYLDGPIKRICAQHSPHPFSPALEQAMLPSQDRLLEEIEAWFEPAETTGVRQ